MHERIRSGIVGRHVGSGIRERESEKNCVVVFEMEKVWEGKMTRCGRDVGPHVGRGLQFTPPNPALKSVALRQVTESQLGLRGWKT